MLSPVKVTVERTGSLEVGKVDQALHPQSIERILPRL